MKLATTPIAISLLLALTATAAHSSVARAQTAEPRQCTGQDDCQSGNWLCKAPGDSGALHGKFVLEDGDRLVRSDGRGPYAEAAGSNVLETATHGAVLLKLAPDTGSVVRSYSVDLNHPVPGGGGKALGVIEETGRDGQAWIAAQWRADSAHVMHNPRSMAIGSRVQSEAITVTVHIQGNPYTLQLGPLPDFHCYDATNRIHGQGTSMGTITRRSTDTWTVEVPPGSKARLFDIRGTAAQAVDLGLYYTSMSFTLFTDRKTFRDR